MLSFVPNASILQPGQQALVHVRGEGRNSVWLPARVIKPTYTKQYPVRWILIVISHCPETHVLRQTMVLQYWQVEYIEGGRRLFGEYSPLDGDIKPDCPYVRELIAEELMWPIDDADREVKVVPVHTRRGVAC